MGQKWKCDWSPSTWPIHSAHGWIWSCNPPQQEVSQEVHTCSSTCTSSQVRVGHASLCSCPPSTRSKPDSYSITQPRASRPQSMLSSLRYNFLKIVLLHTSQCFRSFQDFENILSVFIRNYKPEVGKSCFALFWYFHVVLTYFQHGRLIMLKMC